ncbi:MAG: hypothetical protein WCZ10_14810 [Desulfobulbaceae bacterium]
MRSDLQATPPETLTLQRTLELADTIGQHKDRILRILARAQTVMAQKEMADEKFGRA